MDQLRLAGRPRLAEIDDAIFDATLKIIAEEGYARLGFERLSAVSGVAKATIYRRYRWRGEIVIDALMRYVRKRWPPRNSDTRSVAAYLRAVFRVIAGDVGPALCGLIADAQLNKEFAAVFRDRFIVPRRQALADVMARDPAFAKLGEDRIALALDLAFGPMWYRLLTGHAPLDDPFASQLAASLKAFVQQGQL